MSYTERTLEWSVWYKFFKKFLRNMYVNWKCMFLLGELVYDMDGYFDRWKINKYNFLVKYN